MSPSSNQATLPLAGKRILIFVGDAYEDLEIQYPKYRLREAGATVVLAGEKTGVTHLGKHGYPQITEASFHDLSADDFEGVIDAGGWMPDKLRRSDQVKKLVADFEKQQKMIASICHGAWIDISAGVVRGYKYTSTPGIMDDLINAGVSEWIDAPVVVDRNKISSRRPDDLPDFCRAMIEYLQTN